MTIDTTDERAELWQSALSDTIASGTDARRVFNRTADIETAFVLRERSLVCVDEGIVGGIHLAGSGVLLPFEQLRKECGSAGIQELTTHDNCGAFKLMFPDDPNPNRSAVEWGKETAALLGLPHRHIPAAAMNRPAYLHPAVAIYYDGAGVFNRIPGLPMGFVVSRKHFSSAPDDLALCLQIAFGQHGFGDLFTPRNPMCVIPLEHPEDVSLSLKVLEREVREVAAPFGRRVRISGVKTAWHMRNAATSGVGR
jgi:hypothetical protein